MDGRHWQDPIAPIPVPDGRTAGEDGCALSLADVERSIPARFEKVAEHYPSQTAIGSGMWRPTYRELDAAANRLANALLSFGGRSGDRVALLLQHDGPLVASALAVLKAGRVVVVLNPSDPPDRLTQILTDAEPGLVLTDGPNRPLAGRIAPGGCGVVCFEDNAGIAGGAGPHGGKGTGKPAVEIAPGGLAFLVYTSGSSGRPKGVMHTHRHIIHDIFKYTRTMRLTPEDRIILLASPSGGQGMTTIWCALLNGGALFPFAAMERGVAGLADGIGRDRITVFISSVSLFRSFARTLKPGAKCFPSLRLVRLGSEPASGADFALFREHFNDSCVFIHTLSSSEAGNITQYHLGMNDRVADGPLPLGRPADGIELMLVDQAGGTLPPQAVDRVGEIVLKGRFLSDGYWRNESLTAQRFAAGPDGTRIFRSGDSAMRKADGTLSFMGRNDTQLKVHGYRVDVSEIEAVLGRQEDVLEAAVCTRKAAGGEVKLVAYVVARPGRPCSAQSLSRAMRAILPAYMVPTRFVLLERFPLTPHGKVDRQKLGRIDPPAPAAAAADGPATATESMLAEAWQNVLRREGVGRGDDFFALGGDSLNAIAVAAVVEAALGVQLTLRAFTDNPTLSALAAAIDELREAGKAEGEESPKGPKTRGGSGSPGRVSRDAPIPLSFMQERIWKYSSTAEDSARYTMASNSRILGPLDAAVLRECIGHLASRHEMFRTTFVQGDGAAPMQIIHPSGPQLMGETVDLAGRPDAEARAAELLRQIARRPFDLARLPLARFCLVRIRPEEHLLFWIFHHILADAPSVRVYFRELARLYEARINGRPCLLPDSDSPDRLQYADFAVWHRRSWDPEGRAYCEAVRWWAERLAHLPRPMALPFRRRLRLLGRRIDPSRGQFWTGIEPDVSVRLDGLAREAGATYQMVSLAGLAALLAAETGRRDLILGSYATNRRRLEFQDTFGFFANLIVLRLHCDPSATFRQWLGAVRQTVSEAEARSDIPFEQLCLELRKMGQKMDPSWIQAIISVAGGAEPLRFAGLEMTPQDRRMETMPWGFTVSFGRHDEQGRWQVTFDARLYHPARVRGFVARLGRLFDAASSQPDRGIAKLLGAAARCSPRNEGRK